ncbi:hypothetical protein ACWIUD_11655 [Helicobacter sp. 23-1044]
MPRFCYAKSRNDGNSKLDSVFHAKIAESNINSQNLVKKNQKFAESAPASSLRGSVSVANTTKQSKKIKWMVASLRLQNNAKPKFLYPILWIATLALLVRNDEVVVDCHDSASQNLAMTENSELDSAICANFAESHTKIA